MSSADAARPRGCAPGVSSALTLGGFTLIEVLAAVALLGILYAVLARVAIEGLRAEGDSMRRLGAALLADERMTDLIGATAPPLGHSETIEGDYTLRLDVTPFALPQQWAGVEPVAPLLLAPAPGGEGVQALRTVQLTVHWLEGGNERHVSRTLFLLDFELAAQLASAAANTAGQVSGLGEAPQSQISDEAPPDLPEVPEAPQEP
jgi:prepilin-type N-terminal cleavage/methylation domain-containing protein